MKKKDVAEILLVGEKMLISWPEALPIFPRCKFLPYGMPSVCGSPHKTHEMPNCLSLEFLFSYKP